MRSALLLTLVLACASCTSAVGPGAQRALRYRIVCQAGRHCGSSVGQLAKDGALEIAFAFVENGRGPAVRARLRFAADGTPSAVEIEGKDTFGIALNERLDVEGGRARWKSHAEAGERALEGPAFYVPISPLLEPVGMLAAAALRAGGRIALLPRGEARVEREGATTFRGRHLTVYAVTGLDFTPTRVWLDDDLAFFGNLDPSLSIVREGFEDAVGPLFEIQKKLQARRDRAAMVRAARKLPTAGLAFVHAKVFDAEGGRWLDDHTVVVKGTRIEAVGPSSVLAPPAGAELVDAAGKALVPGLWDLHTHLGAADGPLHIAAGVTTVRDLDNEPARLADLTRRYDDGLAIGPRVLRGGLVEGVGPSSSASTFNIESEAEGRKAIDFYARRGYVQFKFYNSMKPELVAPLARAAHDRGLRVSGHVPFGMIAEDAVRAGYDEIHHINQVMLEFFADRKTDTRTLVRFTLPGDRAADLDLGSKAVVDFIALLRRHRTVIDPTAVTFEQLYLARPGVIDPTVAAVAERLPVLVARGFLAGGLAAPGEKDARYRRSFAVMLAFIKALHAAGVPIVPGTDGTSGFFLHRELELYVQAGITAAEALRLATLGAAGVMGRAAHSGSIAPGKDADLLLVDGDPIARIGDIRRGVSVVKGGFLYDVGAVYESLGVRPLPKR